MRRRSTQRELEEMDAVPVSKRIEMKKEYARKLAEGEESPPDGWVKFPKKLAPYAWMHRPELGLIRISSPNLFSTAHPEHGTAVTEIQGYLDVIARRYPRTPPKRLAKLNTKPDAEVAKAAKKEAETELLGVLAQLHIANHALDQERIANAGIKLQLTIKDDALVRERLENQKLRKAHLRVVK